MASASPPDRSGDTPFGLPAVMDGYPLEKSEKATIDRLLERYRLERKRTRLAGSDDATTPPDSSPAPPSTASPSAPSEGGCRPAAPTPGSSA